MQSNKITISFENSVRFGDEGIILTTLPPHSESFPKLVNKSLTAVGMVLARQRICQS